MLILLTGSLHAGEHGQRYIVILKQTSGAVPDVFALGGTIESRQEEQLVVTIPLASLGALRTDAKVRYVERVGGTPSEGEDSLIGVPADPTPGPASNARFTPHALGSTPWSSGDYLYDGAGNIVSIGSDTYAYDGVQRLRQSATRGTPETYTYDGFGNMTAKTNNGLAQQVPSVETATNRYAGSGYSYNEIGAMVTGASYFLTYDALGQPLSKKYNNDSSTQEYYIYTPGDERIGVQRGTWWTWSVRDEGGKVLRQFRSSTTHPTDPSLWLEDFVWRGGLLLGSQRPPELGGRRHYHLDHLGTPRLVTADNGLRISLHDYFPFGDESTPVSQEVAAGYDREDPMKFTGHERDYAWGTGAEDPHAIDYMHARYASPSLGRFLAVDRVGGMAANPQTWNRYAYSRNNPIGMVDPDGNLAFPWHIAISYAAARSTGMSVGSSISLAFKVGWVDFRRNSQSGQAASTNMHAMRGFLPNGVMQTVEQGRAGTAASIAGSLARGDLAAALHTTQDEPVPLHNGHEWRGSYLSLGLSGAIAHFFGDLFPSEATVKAAYDGTVALLGGEAEDEAPPIENAPHEESNQTPASWWSRDPVGTPLLRRYYIRPFDYNDPFRGTGFCDASNTCH